MKLPRIATSVTMLCFAIPAHAAPQVLFREDFTGASLNAQKWSVASWKLGRTRLGNGPIMANGMARLRFDTFDPKNPGVGLMGTEIDTVPEFELGQGLEIEARVRVNSMPPGLVTSLFTYTEWASAGITYSDEIDFEFLTKQIAKPHQGGDPVAVTTYHAFNNTKPNYDDITQTDSENINVAGLKLAKFNTFVIRWTPGRVQWLVNGKLIKSTTNAVPTRTTPIRLNFWAPDSGWDEAFSKALVPAKTARENRVYYYDVDYLEVRRP